MIKISKHFASPDGYHYSHPTTAMSVTVWEDNSGALILANLEPGRMTPHSKHCGVKYHWFREHLKPNCNRGYQD